MRIYRDSTIEDLKGLATQIERFGGSCSPIVQTLLREAKKSILGGKLSEAVYPRQFTDSGDRYPLSSYKVSEFRRALESFLKVLNGIYYKMKY